ncbi:hypothetical protein Micbo1qcDRAFT_155901 [Microdochium bolleyi]|uniref:Uncharacterized protein n=1 Tax=Microdochium bolleyi TaxID=196109 RepID=A0A136JIZ2_9PEZI|nr:hypothetical protein Micbo1qcDRAFT_155901 [Microdochium bolleyi]
MSRPPPLFFSLAWKLGVSEDVDVDVDMVPMCEVCCWSSSSSAGRRKAGWRMLEVGSTRQGRQGRTPIGAEDRADFFFSFGQEQSQLPRTV